VTGTKTVIPITMKIFEILVPTIYGDTKKPISTKHHRSWDSYVRKITGGLTILSVARGQWVHEKTKKLFVERVIPVRIACEDAQIDEIVNFTLLHYRQHAVLFYLVSDKVEIRYSS
jgi:hypothetical protein